MKVACEKHILLEALTNVQHAVSAKSTLPTLEGILLRASGSSLYLVGYDLSIGITTTIEAEVSEPGEIVLTAKLICEIVRKMPDDIVYISVDDKFTAVIKCADVSFTLIGISAMEYPELPSVNDGIGITLPQNTLKSMISQTLFAVAQSDERPVHTGVLFEIEPGTLRLVAVDGSRLAIRCEKVNCNETMHFIVPGKTMNEIRSLMSDENSPISLAVGQRHVVMEIDGYAVISRLLEGEFLPYRKAVPQNVTTTVKINTREFISAVERAALVISDRVKSPLLCEFKDNRVVVSCTTSLGSVVDNVSARIDNSEEEMGFNSKFLLDALKNTDTDEIRIELCGSLSPMKILPLEGEDFLFLVLPVRLKKG